MADHASQKYVPLSLTLNNGDLGLSGLVGTISFYEPPSYDEQLISLSVANDGCVFSGTRKQPESAIIFVNSTVDTFRKFIDAHAEFTNTTIDKCQLDGTDDFNKTFVDDIAHLVVRLHQIDNKAMKCQNNWWPMILDETLADYRSKLP